MAERLSAYVRLCMVQHKQVKQAASISALAMATYKDYTHANSATFRMPTASAQLHSCCSELSFC